MKMQVFILLTVALLGHAALQAQSSPAETLAGRIADRMRDSLSLSAGQRSAIYTANMQLHERKMNIRRDHASAPAEWTALMQRVENTRDSIYQTILQNEEKFQLYKMKKKELVNNN